MSAKHVVCTEKSHEIEAIPRLLAAFELQGCNVTVDAISTQTTIAEPLHEAGADYVLSLKANQIRMCARFKPSLAIARQETCG